jgi:YHS domain-containing protein
MSGARLHDLATQCVLPADSRHSAAASHRGQQGQKPSGIPRCARKMPMAPHLLSNAVESLSSLQPDGFPPQCVRLQPFLSTRPRELRLARSRGPSPHPSAVSWRSERSERSERFWRLTPRMSQPSRESTPGAGTLAARDVVCGKTVNPQVTPWSVPHGDATYYFCSLSCALQFKSAPAAFAPPGADRQRPDE